MNIYDVFPSFDLDKKNFKEFAETTTPTKKICKKGSFLFIYSSNYWLKYVQQMENKQSQI